MKRLSLAVVLLALPIVVQAQNGTTNNTNCSEGLATHPPSDQSYNSPPCPSYPATVTTSMWEIITREFCVADANNAQALPVGDDYWDLPDATHGPSSIFGTGQKRCLIINGSNASVDCVPRAALHIINGGQSGSDYYANRFYNDIWPTTVSSSGVCSETGLVNEDFKQCQTIACGGGGGGGGGGSPCPNPVGDPPYCGTTEQPAWNTSSCNWYCAPNSASSPILIDVSAKGFVLTGLANSVNFDIAGNGQARRLGWTAKGVMNAFLCLPDANGACDDGKDLFGNFTPQPPSATPNGYAALAVYDTNHDGVIDSRDPVFSSLRLWVDLNHDGVSQSNEIFTLPALGVYSLSLKYTEDRKMDQYGNLFRYRAKVNPNDPSDTGRWAYDVFFVTTTTITKNTKPANGGAVAAQVCPPRPLLPEAKEGRLR